MTSLQTALAAYAGKNRHSYPRRAAAERLECRQQVRCGGCAPGMRPAGGLPSARVAIAAPSASRSYRSVILDAIETRADITLGEIAEMLRRDRGTTCASSTVWRFLDRHAMTLKKNGARSRAGQARRRRAAQGFGWTRSLSSMRTASSSSMRLAPQRKWRGVYGRAKRGKRCCAAVPHGHWKTPHSPVHCAGRA